MTDTHQPTSTRPYLIRALYEWCTDNGFTPYVAVQVDHSVQVPREFVKNGEIVLDISFGATSSLKLDNDFIEFKARFGGIAREIIVPIGRVVAIYASENGEGMAFPPPIEAGEDGIEADEQDAHDELIGVDESLDAASADTTKELQRSPLRDASRTAEADGSKVFHLVSSESGDDSSSSGDESRDDTDEPPRPPSPNGGAKPSLKRVK